MSYKIKSFVYLSCFIAAFTIYSFNGAKSENTYSDPTEIAIAELDQITPKLELNIQDTK